MVAGNPRDAAAVVIEILRIDLVRKMLPNRGRHSDATILCASGVMGGYGHREDSRPLKSASFDASALAPIQRRIDGDLILVLLLDIGRLLLRLRFDLGELSSDRTSCPSLPARCMGC
jgi:hypothetical protein